MRRDFREVRARNGRVIRILFIVRVSSPGEGKQDIRSNDDQVQLLREFVKANIREPYEIVVISGTGSGENLSRPQFLELYEKIESEQFDLVLVEDLARIARRLKTHDVCELCIDCGTRLISLNDNVDTADEGWEDRSIFAAWHHQRSNRDTSLRIKRSLNNHFTNGGALSLPIFGYIKPKGAKSDAEVQKDPAAEPIYREWFRRLEEGASFSSIADWLNAEKIPMGPYVTKEMWTGTIVASTTRNTILKGERFHNGRESYRVNNPGIYKTRAAAPESRRTRIVPHWAFFAEGYYDRVIALIDQRTSKYGRGEVDPLLHRPKKKTRFPGQCIVCGICNYRYVFGGHGQTDHLMCDGARAHRCWNGATVDGPLAAEKISNALFKEFELLEGFDAEFLAAIEAEACQSNLLVEGQLLMLKQKILEIEVAIKNVLKFVREGAGSSALQDELQRLEFERIDLERQATLERVRKVERIVLPPIEDLKKLGRAKFSEFAIDSFEFADAMRRFTPRIVVLPYQLVDGGAVVLRAKVRLQLASLITDAATRSVVQPSLERLLTLDLFEPPQREAHREEVVNSRHAGESEASIAARLGLTVTAVQRAMALQRLMDKLGVTDAYQPLLLPPEGGKLQRHRHPRYRFEPLSGAGEV